MITRPARSPASPRLEGARREGRLRSGLLRAPVGCNGLEPAASTRALRSGWPARTRSRGRAPGGASGSSPGRGRGRCGSSGAPRPPSRGCDSPPARRPALKGSGEGGGGGGAASGSGEPGAGEEEERGGRGGWGRGGGGGSPFLRRGSVRGAEPGTGRTRPLRGPAGPGSVRHLPVVNEAGENRSPKISCFDCGCWRENQELVYFRLDQKNHPGKRDMNVCNAIS